ncbi:MAG: 4-diphosphocytidyl-2-C-methyl-D-erythritol kinase [Solirubrobacterales bacterium]|jgi:4-diphosphocytidyl-2-C-methyl-D-erythritol kinase|nr:4-diphosphocytidyl-2-C-methyl-D-erythritol kinase [Solirubrobacterales bacterium]
MIVEAPAKLNLCLYVGPPRPDGLHEVRSIFQPLDLADRISISEGAEADEVLCPAIEGPELASAALARLRDAGWDGPRLRIEIEKRIPVAAGLGGGSADAAAVLRLAAGEVDGLEAIAAGLGADVPSQLAPRTALVCGAGEHVEPIAEPAPFAIVLVPIAPGLSAAEVYAEADRLGGLRSAEELAQLGEALAAVVAAGASPLEYADLLVNDLQPAAVSLRPAIAAVLGELRDAGARAALVTGSGPTAFGLFADRDEAEQAAGALAVRGAIVAEPRRAL